MSGFNAETFVNWKKSKGMYSFTSLPKNVLLSPQKSSFKDLKSFFSKKVKGITGEHILYKENLLLSTNFGVGATALVSLCEELRVLGVENFYFIGMAGRLSENIVEAELRFVSKAISELGLSNSYQTDEIQSVDSILNLGIKDTTCWSTDTPFRETTEKVLKYKNMQAEFVDMEIAGLYSFANFYKLNANAFVVGADLVNEKTWKPVTNMNNLNKALADATNKIVNKL